MIQVSSVRSTILPEVITIELPSKYVAFNFQPTVIVTRSIPKVTVVNVVNDIGSSLGLWLGASAFSIFKMIPTTQTFCSYRRASRYLNYLTLAAATVATFLFLSFGLFWILLCIVQILMSLECITNKVFFSS